MATSCTIGLTTINTAKLLEKALRRCGISPALMTPEIVEQATESLYLFMLSMASRGLNLWCIDNELLPLTAGKRTYVLPIGTTDVLNLLHCTPSRAGYTTSSTATDFTAVCTVQESVVRYGVKFSALPTTSFEFQTSGDGIIWDTVQTTLATSLQPAGVYTWFDVATVTPNTQYRVYSTALGVVDDLLLATRISEIVVAPFNRDDYTSQPSKNQQGQTATNYWFEKLVNPQITLWPVPSDDSRHLSLYRYRQIQDIGGLTNTLELPARWLEPISWQLSARLAFELPGVDAGRRAEVIQMAGTMTIEVEGGETDSAPTYFAPNISVYTK